MNLEHAGILVHRMQGIVDFVILVPSLQWHAITVLGPMGASRPVPQHWFTLRSPRLLQAALHATFCFLQ